MKRRCPNPSDLPRPYNTILKLKLILLGLEIDKFERYRRFYSIELRRFKPQRSQVRNSLEVFGTILLRILLDM